MQIVRPGRRALGSLRRAKCERQRRDEAPAFRTDRDACERVSEVGFVEGGDRHVGVSSARCKTFERELVRRLEHDEVIRAFEPRPVDLRMCGDEGA